MGVWVFLLLNPALLLAFGLLYWVAIALPVRMLQRRWPRHWLLRERGDRGGA